MQGRRIAPVPGAEWGSAKHENASLLKSSQREIEHQNPHPLTHPQPTQKSSRASATACIHHHLGRAAALTSTVRACPPVLQPFFTEPGCCCRCARTTPRKSLALYAYDMSYANSVSNAKLKF
eukprot:558233-Rhodomonas_salina.2